MIKQRKISKENKLIEFRNAFVADTAMFAPKRLSNLITMNMRVSICGNYTACDAEMPEI